MRLTDILQTNINEAKITRRGLLKGLAGATAATVLPKTPAVAPAATVPDTVAAITPPANDIIKKLWDKVKQYGDDLDFFYDRFDDTDTDTPTPTDTPTDELNAGQTYGYTPWGERANVRLTPKNRQYLITSNPGGSTGIITYPKGNRIEVLEIEWDIDDPKSGGIYHYEDPKTPDIYFAINSSARPIRDKNDIGRLVDAIIDGEVPSTSTNVGTQVGQALARLGITLTDLAKKHLDPRIINDIKQGKWHTELIKPDSKSNQTPLLPDYSGSDIMPKIQAGKPLEPIVMDANYRILSGQETLDALHRMGKSAEVIVIDKDENSDKVDDHMLRLSQLAGINR